MGKKIIAVSLFITMLCAAIIAHSQDEKDEVVKLSDSIGVDIDKTEREKYGLFPDIEDFHSARIIRLSESKYRLEYGCEHTRGIRHKSKTISADAFELTRVHIRLSDDYNSIGHSDSIGPGAEAESLYRLGLKYASRGQYDIASKLLKDLVIDFPGSRQAIMVQNNYPNIEDLLKSKRGLFQRGSLIDQSGRTDVLVFSGYYGLWLGVATPIYFEADSPQAYALGLLLGGPLSVAVANIATKGADISDGKATMISLGGHLGTWQGIGWAVLADLEGNQIVGMGELGGLAGIATATILTSKVEFSEGHASLTNSGLPWGAWFGLVTAAMVGHEDNDILRDMLIGSDILVVGTGIAAREVKMSSGRVRLINLAGVIGTVFGFGIDLLIEADEEAAILGIAGTGSIIGLAAGAALTKDYDKDRELSSRDANNTHLTATLGKKGTSWSITPVFKLRHGYDSPNSLTPLVGIQLNL